MSNVRDMTDEELRSEYRSSLRQNTRASLGVATSGVMTAIGLVYMVLPCGIAAHGAYESNKAIRILETEIRRRGLSRRGDWIKSRLIGTVEKAATTALFLGHDEVLYATENLGMGCGLVDVSNEVADHSVTSGLNGIVNAPLDEVKSYVGYENGDPAHLATLVPLAATAAAVEVAVNRTGYLGAQIRSRARA